MWAGRRGGIGGGEGGGEWGSEEWGMRRRERGFEMKQGRRRGRGEEAGES